MKILEEYVVTFKGKCTGSLSELAMQQFTLQDDDGNRYLATIPDQGSLVKAFRYMSDNNLLRHLRDLEPKFSTNAREIQSIIVYNDSLWEEDPDGIERIYKPGGMSVRHRNARQVPEFVYEASWTFFDKGAAVMLKLAVGGDGDF